ncbi:PLP-dependent aminotransferase family protein [Lentzea tibetensis]|uniref:PLP-dependent aminotransferase family protein n=1 Tax=Lentzea tibetensis TaxID=2591470 RepID=A0A563F0F4_9PSEU|nr:PLP-dependent aminotransferase family protein [Lentzea tibetensis]TWP53373.1 PLP-dependent aminotransferase family protein [Lentzea tibetensis]
MELMLAGSGDLVTQIYRQLHDAMLDGRLRPGERLPPTRELARSLQVSRNTVATAYERLTAEGFLVGRVGAGTFVSTVRPGRARSAPRGADLRPREVWRDLRSESRPAAEIDFSVGFPDARLFPLQTWRRLVTQSLTGRILGQYAPPEGHDALREAIARHIGIARSVRASADDVLVTNGAQQALDLIGRVLVAPGTTVAVEEPGYPPARLLFETLGARVVGVPVDREGIVVDALPKARLVYVTPSHQFPLGTPMSLARRTALLDWAQRHDAVVVEDDYDSEFRFSDRPLEPLQSLDRTGRVVYVGSFSKTLVPALRLGFLVAPASLREALRQAKKVSDWHTGLPDQIALARFIDEGQLARHVRKATKVYAARHERVVAAVERLPWLRLVPSAAGLHVCALADSPVVSRDPAVVVEPLSRYRGGNGVVIGFGAVGLDRIDEGLSRAFGHL